MISTNTHKHKFYSKFQGDATNEVTLPLAKFNSQVVPYLPVEWFKPAELDKPALCRRFFRADQLDFEFVSSHTSHTLPSKSPFSLAGLNRYRISCLKHFKHFIDSTELDGPEIYSLIAPTSAQTHSSLSWMLEWIGTEFDIVQTTTHKFNCRSDKPIVVFATAFQLVELCQNSQNYQLHPKSILIETGGLKGHFESIEPEKYLQTLQDFFGLNQDRIFSEYGMSEFSAQAYGPCQGYLKFSPEVDVVVMTEPGVLAKQGKGLLCIKDPQRIDFPYFMRTEDIVELIENGSFKFCGRSQAAPLKGCSLNYLSANEKMTFEDNLIKVQDQHSENLSTKIKSWQNHYKSEVFQTELLSTLTEDLSSASQADFFTNQLNKNFLQDCKNLIEACEISNAQKALGEKRQILFILPQNHIIAGIYPLFFAVLGGADKLIIRPPRLNLKTLELLLESWQKFFGMDIQLLEQNSRLDTLDYQGSIFFMGSTTTALQLRLESLNQWFGFDEYRSASLLNQADIEDPKILSKYTFDHLALNGKGCLNPQLSFIPEKSLEQINRVFQSIDPDTSDYWQQEFERARLSQGGKLWTKAAFKSIQSGSNIVHMSEDEWLNQAKYFNTNTLHIIITYSEKQLKPETLATCKKLSLSKFYSSELVQDFATSPHGSSQDYSWDGTFQGKRLFKNL